MIGWIDIQSIVSYLYRRLFLYDKLSSIHTFTNYFPYQANSALSLKCLIQPPPPSIMCHNESVFYHLALLIHDTKETQPPPAKLGY